MIATEVGQVVRFLKTTSEKFQRGSHSRQTCHCFPWMKNEHGRVNKAIWPEGPGILRISVSCGEKMKHLPVCNPISWWLSVDIGLLREWAWCSGCWFLMRNRLPARGQFWDLTIGAKETHQHLDTYCPKSSDGTHICTTFHCNIHDENNIVGPYIFHWLKTTIISTSMTARILKGNGVFGEHSQRHNTQQNRIQKTLVFPKYFSIYVEIHVTSLTF